MQTQKVLLGFSGGIDSCRAAALLKEQGYRVTAICFDMYGDRQTIEKARRSAENLDLPFRTADITELFRTTVIRYFTSEYLLGRTPVPCTVCNRDIKWRLLHRIALEENYDRIATGHYFNIVTHNGKHYVARPADTVKDQSYYLWSLGEDILSVALAPMGDQIKSELERPASHGTPYRESMSVCFLDGRGVSRFIGDECGAAIREGDIVDSGGNVIGCHQGIPYYTIGQKRGLGLPAGMCVTAIDPRLNRLTAGYDADLYHRNLILSGCNVIDPDELFPGDGITVKIRGIGRNPTGGCRVTPSGEGLHITLDDPAWAPAAGQSVVLYNGDRVVGGGFLERYF